MKKKYLIQEWEKVQENYYNYFERDELQKEYNEWFFNLYLDENSICEDMTNDEMIKELIKSELEFRIKDNIEDIKETIEHIKSLSVI